MKQMLLVIALASMGCTHLRSFSVTTIPEDRSRPIKAAGQRIVFLGINPSNDYADDVVADLLKQCPDGRVSGIITRYETAMVVPVFAYANRVYVEGHCVVDNGTGQP